ncbi:Acyl-CoA dehydrogenase/oxidase [Penicillium concentricum]|uniref:Acyl-CoA dehydrogenase/oxidase n=1 Tax=Penicillium concentricum TaxID=293559 RepID=A0A9W9SRB3_9EURO|nr:Acyl-CoA dehydrogenase/oxidase [Penicillium concentricum]KAJ5383076.1 Acyl-CoA dehydrogenase/oxidase [Penicillium concentricum]
MTSSSLELLRLPVFKDIPRDATDHERIYLSYQRAAAATKAYGMTAVDILQCTQKFWDIHLDIIGVVDCAAFTLMTIQINLAAGTLAPFAEKQPQYRELLNQMLNFEISAQYMLTEVGHGLDAKNLETTATMLPSGEFDLHTPSPSAAKIMPPSSPVKGLPRVGIVFAQLIVSGENRGIRPFITWLSDGNQMCNGVTSKLLPRRAASKPVDHAITSFTHIRLPHSALLGTVDKPKDMRKHFMSSIWRIGVGTLGLSLTMVPTMKRSVFVAGKYSQRRHILGPDQKPKPIISFRTQYGPILHGLAQIFVFEAYAQKSIQYFQDPSLTELVQHSIGAMFKAVLCKTSQACHFTLSERCGGQGLFENNHIIEAMLETRGISIAEGDILVLCIRLASELLLNRYQMPPAKDPSSFLAKHEQGLLDELHRMAKGISGGHRGEDFNRLILPRSQELVEAIGYRIAYDAATETGVHTDLVALYEIWVMLQDQSWFVQHVGLTREDMFQMEAERLSAVLPRLDALLDATGAEPYCNAPILSQTSWEHFVDQLETKTGNGTTDIGYSRGRAML